MYKGLFIVTLLPFLVFIIVSLMTMTGRPTETMPLTVRMYLIYFLAWFVSWIYLAYNRNIDFTPSSFWLGILGIVISIPIQILIVSSSMYSV